METFTELQQNPFFTPSVIILASLIIGFIFQRIIVSRLGKISEKTKWEGDDIIVAALGNAPMLWFLLGGIYTVIFDIPLEETYRTLLWQLLLIITVLSIAIVGSKIATGFIQFYANQTSGALQSTSMFSLMAKLSIYLIGLLVVLQTLGISTTPLLTALGVGGLAVALALQETLSNLFAGLHIIAAGNIRPGNFIETEAGDNGEIQDISWRSTTIRTIGNNLVIIPNAKLASSTITNYESPQNEMSITINCGVSYNSNLEQVEKIVKDVGVEILKKVEGAVADYEPLVRFYNFGESSIDFKVVLRVQQFTDQYILTHEFIKALHARFEKEGIEIPFPQRVVHKAPSLE